MKKRNRTLLEAIRATKRILHGVQPNAPVPVKVRLIKAFQTAENGVLTANELMETGKFYSRQGLCSALLNGPFRVVGRCMDPNTQRRVNLYAYSGE